MLDSAHTRDQSDLMGRDCALPDDIVPARAFGTRRHVLVTGASGFLGRYILATLLAKTDLTVTCLVRSRSETEARERLREALVNTCREVSTDSRLRVVCGDVAQPCFGLTSAEFDALAQDVDLVLHCAAEVNWIKGYGALRRANVIGTLNTIRFACHGASKPVCFVSTLAVCYAAGGPARVTEDTDMAPYLDRIPLGYAQGKCVSEILLRQAAARGLPVTIVRSGLICGDSQTGRSNENDLISRVIKGSIVLGCAADVNWPLDCCPVDYVAEAVAALTLNTAPGCRIVHVHQARPQHWRELVLWMNLYGYALELVEFDAWIDRLNTATRRAAADLFALRPFFNARPGVLSGRRLPELYFEPMRNRISSEQSFAALAALGLRAPSLNTPVLECYFERYAATGYLPPAKARTHLHCKPRQSDADFLQAALRKHLGDPLLTVLDSERLPVGESGLLSELSSAYCGRRYGISRHLVSYRRAGSERTEQLETLLKIKPADHVLRKIAEKVGYMQSRALGSQLARFPDALGATGAHRRELAICESGDWRLARHMPRIFATIENPSEQYWLIAMEFLDDAEPLDSFDSRLGWDDDRIGQAVSALADIHATWYGKECELLAHDWMPPGCDGESMTVAAPLWQVLAEHAAAYFSTWLGEPTLPLQRRLIDRLPAWHDERRRQRWTLIHNDFNPRNVVFRCTSDGPRLCAFDWELATLGLPQHDLAELLCFALPDHAGPAYVAGLLERHRQLLERHTSHRIEVDDWIRGYRLSLDDLLVNRFAAYTLIEKFKPQRFMPRVLKNWRRLYQFQTHGLSGG